jgi:hypothetical protein
LKTREIRTEMPAPPDMGLLVSPEMNTPMSISEHGIILPGPLHG